jgi:hypothetical protein
MKEENRQNIQLYDRRKKQETAWKKDGLATARRNSKF